VLVELADPAGDEDGPGSTTYPTSPLYGRGVFDLRALRVTAATGQSYRFEVELGSARVPDPERMISDARRLGDVCPQAPCLQTIDIYIDAGLGTGPGVDWLFPGRRLRLAEGERWTRAVLLTPRPMRARSALRLLLRKGEAEQGAEVEGAGREERSRRIAEFMDRHVLFPEDVRRKGRKLVFRVPRRWLGNDPRACRYQVLVSCTELVPAVDLLELLRKRLVARRFLIVPPGRTAGPWAPGGGDGSATYPAPLDIPDPAGKAGQQELLRRRDESRTAAIPLVAPPNGRPAAGGEPAGEE